MKLLFHIYIYIIYKHCMRVTFSMRKIHIYICFVSCFINYISMEIRRSSQSPYPSCDYYMFKTCDLRLTKNIYIFEKIFVSY